METARINCWRCSEECTDHNAKSVYCYSANNAWLFERDTKMSINSAAIVSIPVQLSARAKHLGWDTLGLAAAAGQQDEVLWLMMAGAGKSRILYVAFTKASSVGHVEEVVCVMLAARRPHTVDADRGSVLCHASANGHVATVRVLLQVGKVAGGFNPLKV